MVRSCLIAVSDRLTAPKAPKTTSRDKRDHLYYFLGDLRGSVVNMRFTVLLSSDKPAHAGCLYNCLGTSARHAA